jgi:hypothetical protein
MVFDTEVQKRFHAHGLDISIVKSKKRPVMLVKTTPSGIGRILTDLDKNPKNWKEATDADESFTRGTEDFCGGTKEGLLKAMQGDVDLAPFFKAKDEIAKTPLMERLKKAFKPKPRRRRRHVDSGGKLNINRVFEDKPFSRLKKQDDNKLVIDIVADFSISAYVKAKDINEYATMLWAISDAIEKAGHTAKLHWKFQPSEFNSKRTHDLELDVLVKDANQYVTPVAIAAIFSSNFYRRGSFAITKLVAETIGDRAAYGLGHVTKSGRKPIQFEDGVLYCMPDMIHHRKEGSKNMVDEILKAIGE